MIYKNLTILFFLFSLPNSSFSDVLVQDTSIDLPVAPERMDYSKIEIGGAVSLSEQERREILSAIGRPVSSPTPQAEELTQDQERIKEEIHKEYHESNIAHMHENGEVHGSGSKSVSQKSKNAGKTQAESASIVRKNNDDSQQIDLKKEENIPVSHNETIEPKSWWQRRKERRRQAREAQAAAPAPQAAAPAPQAAAPAPQAAAPAPQAAAPAPQAAAPELSAKEKLDKMIDSLGYGKAR